MKNLKAILLDRDGVINVKASEGDYIKHQDELVLLEGVGQAIMKINEQGLLALVVSNQRGIGRKLMSLENVNRVNNKICELIKPATIQDFYICPHLNRDNCKCRKPKPGLLTQAMTNYKLEPDECIMIGDSPSDIEAAQSANVSSIYLGKKPLKSKKLVLASTDSLLNAIDIILSQIN